MRSRIGIFLLALAALFSLGASCGGKQPGPPPAFVIAAFGDSLTSHGKWFGALPASWTHYDHGIAGQTCDQIVTRLEAEAAGLVVDTVVLLCGTNDVRRGDYDVDETVATIADGIAAAQAEGFAVVIGAPPPMFDANAGDANARLADLHDRLETLAVLNGAAFADIWSTFWSFGDPLPLYGPDLIHPNADGLLLIGTDMKGAVCCQ